MNPWSMTMTWPFSQEKKFVILVVILCKQRCSTGVWLLSCPQLLITCKRIFWQGRKLFWLVSSLDCFFHTKSRIRSESIFVMSSKVDDIGKAKICVDSDSYKIKYFMAWERTGKSLAFGFPSILFRVVLTLQKIIKCVAIFLDFL